MSTRASRSLLSHKHLIPWNYSHLGNPRETCIVPEASLLHITSLTVSHTHPSSIISQTDLGHKHFLVHWQNICLVLRKGAGQ